MHKIIINKIFIGYITRCQENSATGTLIGHKNEYNIRDTFRKNFNKPCNYIADNGELCIFTLNEKTDQVENVRFLKDFNRYNRTDSIERKESILQGPIFYNNGILSSLKGDYISYDNFNNACAYIVIGDNSCGSAIKRSLSSFQIDILRLWMARENLRSRLEPSLFEITKKFNEIDDYVDKFDLSKTLETYVVGKSQEYIRRCGRDDDCTITEFKRISDDTDSYIKSLVPLEEKNYEGDYLDDKFHYYINEEQTALYREKASILYSKDDHMAYLKKEFFDEFKANNITYNRINYKLKIIFNIVNYYDLPELRILEEEKYLKEYFHK